MLRNLVGSVTVLEILRWSRRRRRSGTDHTTRSNLIATAAHVATGDARQDDGQQNLSENAQHEGHEADFGGRIASVGAVDDVLGEVRIRKADVLAIMASVFDVGPYHADRDYRGHAEDADAGDAQYQAGDDAAAPAVDILAAQDCDRAQADVVYGAYDADGACGRGVAAPAANPDAPAEE